MPERISLISTLWLTSLMALVASVMVVPVRMSGPVAVSSPSDCLRGGFNLAPAQPTKCLSAAMATDDVLLADDLPSEMEEQDWADLLDEPRITFPIPCSFRKVPDRRLIASRSILSPYPLRC